MDVIAEVIYRQTQEKLSDVKFAKKLGISRHMWGAILKGKRQPGYKVWNAIIETYPDLYDDVMDVIEARLRQTGGKPNGMPKMQEPPTK